MSGGATKTEEPAPSGSAQTDANDCNDVKLDGYHCETDKNAVENNEMLTDSDDDVVLKERTQDKSLRPGWQRRMRRAQDRMTDCPKIRNTSSFLQMSSVQPATLRKYFGHPELALGGEPRIGQDSRRSTGGILSTRRLSVEPSGRHAAKPRSPLSCACVPRSERLGTTMFLERLDPCAGGANCSHLARRRRGPFPCGVLLPAS